MAGLDHDRCAARLESFGEGTCNFGGQGFLRRQAARVDVYEAREAAGLDDVYLMRVEQLYPFPARALIGELGRFPQAEIVWCQEEPRNMGAWSFAEPNIEWVLEHVGGKAKRARYVGRPASASTAAGTMALHQMELAAFLDARR